MVPFLVDTLEQRVRIFYSKFLLSDAIEKASTLTRLWKLDVLDKNIQRQDVDVGFSINYDVIKMKKEGNSNDSKIREI